MGTSSILRSNSLLKITQKEKEGDFYDFDLAYELEEIENKSNIPRDVKVEYVAAYSSDRSHKKCDVCGSTENETYIKKIKVLGLHNIDGYYKVKVESKEDREIYSAIIERMRNIFFHNLQVCDSCDANGQHDDKNAEEEFEALEALHDVKKHYDNLSELENLGR